MAYTDEAVSAKLSALNETQDSIVTVAQWIMFHRRHADRTAALWLQKLKDASPNKRLNLVYLANEVAQQSKARRKEDFLIAFSPVIAEATAAAYRSAPSEVQVKLRRVVEVWRQRQIFETTIQDAIEARMDELNKSRSSGKKPALGGSLFSGSSGSAAPSEIQPLVPLQVAVSKATATKSGSVPDATAEYSKLMDASAAVPTPPVYAARLSGLLKKLASAEANINESLKSRRELLKGLETLVAGTKTALDKDEQELASVTEKKAKTEQRKREVEDDIMRGLTAEGDPPNDGSLGADFDVNGRASSTPMPSTDPDRPDVEELTPPPMLPGEQTDSATAADANAARSSEAAQTSTAPPPQQVYAQAGADLLSSLNVPSLRQYSHDPETEGSAPKKMRIDDESAVFGTAGSDPMADLDEDVAAMIRQEAGQP